MNFIDAWASLILACPGLALWGVLLVARAHNWIESCLGAAMLLFVLLWVAAGVFVFRWLAEDVEVSDEDQAADPSSNQPPSHSS